jgi:hypothetical protein
MGVVLVERVGLGHNAPSQRKGRRSVLRRLLACVSAPLSHRVLAARQANHEEGTEHRDHSLEARALRHGDQE